MDTVSFTLQAGLLIHHVPKRARKERHAHIVHEYTVNIPVIELDDAPLAFSWEEGVIERRLYDGALWMPVSFGAPSKKEFYTREMLNRDIASGARRPVLNYKSNLDSRYSYPEGERTTLQTLKDAGSEITSTAQIKRCEEYVAQEKLVLIDGVFWKEAREPLYQVMSFGMGSNHGGTALVVTEGADLQDPRDTYFFPADALQDAIDYTSRSAKRRGDTNSLPIIPHDVITVHLSEVVTVRNPKHGHGFNLDGMTCEKLTETLESISHKYANQTLSVYIEFIKKKGMEVEFKQHVASLIDSEYNNNYNKEPLL